MTVNFSIMYFPLISSEWVKSPLHLSQPAGDIFSSHAEKKRNNCRFPPEDFWDISAAGIVCN